MVQIIKCMLMIVGMLMIGYLWSVYPRVCMHLKMKSNAVKIMVGFFTYMIIFQGFQIVGVIIMGMSLSVLSNIWAIIVVVFTIGSILLNKKVYNTRKQFEIIQYIHNPVLLILCFVVIVTVGFSTLNSYQGWDTAYYVNILESALEKNKLFVTGPADGYIALTLPLKYALQGLFAHFAVLSYLFHVDARIMAMYGMRGLCVILSCIIIYAIGKVLFDEDRKKAAYLVMIWLAFQIFATADHTTAYFMFVRGYEAKGYCANVVLPMVLLCILALLRRDKGEQWWMILGIVTWASVPLSMSALVIAPAAIAVYGIIEMIRSRTIRPIMTRCILCVLPNMIYLVVFLLESKALLAVGV